MANKKTKNYNQCKVKNCKGKPTVSGFYQRGFCCGHYSQFLNGNIDIMGRKTHKNRFDKSIRNLNRALNEIEQANDAFNIQKKKKSPILKIEVNKETVKRSQETEEKLSLIRSSSFVVGNIEHLQNDTVRRLLSSKSGRKIEWGTHYSIKPDDQVEIIRLVHRKAKDETIKSRFPKYRESDLLSFIVDVENGNITLDKPRRKRKR